ncbi:hypothetical protein D9Q98_001958 [Chlorella vulgaris]|uniref:Glutathione S-transferase 3, mitochondrial n=1 Tax=Chlorella vulgaris TaxID=3077 RepID=A0A9D4Z078_CHLVU|nr:hypothetical protein D9Q98_001958 [Chlorella vulgaris]
MFESSTLLELRPAHGAVLALLAGGFAVHNVWMSLKVGQARKKFGVKYPALYEDATKPNAKAFNCVQRAHQNSLENLPSFYALLLVAGIRYPVSASIAGAVALVGRIAYFIGYSTGEPSARTRGAFTHLGVIALAGMVARWAVELIAPAFE